jgi:beta-glucuronidase
VPATFAIPELGLSVALPVIDGRAHARLPATPERWAPANPKRYDVEVRLGEDRVSDRIGFRTLAVEGAAILLNGAPIRLNGISVHEDDRDTGKATSEADIRRRFAHVKELGGNFVRLAHYPHHERAAEIADELGLMLWEEVPVYWAIAFADPGTYADAENQLTELILRDRNRASVILWSVGNENVDDDARLSFMRRLVETARRLDGSRLVTAACLVNHDTCRIDDRLAEHLDVIGMNEYYGWYSPHWDHLGDILANAPPDRPLIVSEFGADALAGLIEPAGQPFTETFQAEVYRRQLAILGEYPCVVGITPWILYDFRSPRRQNRYQKGWNLKGLIAADKTTKKQAFAVLQRFYASRATG